MDNYEINILRRDGNWKKVKPNDKEWIINNIKLPIGDHILFKHLAVDTDIEKVTKYNWNDKKFAVRPIQLLISKK